MSSLLPTGQGYTRLQLAFKYDYLGRRIQKTVTNLDTSATTFSRRFLYDGWNLIAELDSTGASIQRSYTWGLDVAGTFTATGGVGALLQITDWTTNTTYLPTYDGNGNVSSLINAADGTVAATYEYSPFGELLRRQEPASGGYAKLNPFRFSTKYTDEETGLVYYGHRYYSPSLGRFINRDPIEEAGGVNLYAMCGNNAVTSIDVLGNGIWDTIKAWFTGGTSTAFSNDPDTGYTGKEMNGKVQHVDDDHVIDESGQEWEWRSKQTLNGARGDWYKMPDFDYGGDYAKQNAIYSLNASNTLAGINSYSPSSESIDPSKPKNVLTVSNGKLTSDGGTAGTVVRKWTVANPTKSGYIIQHVIRKGPKDEYWEAWPVVVENGRVSYPMSQIDQITFSDNSRTRFSDTQTVVLEATFVPGYALSSDDNWEPSGLFRSGDLMSVNHAPAGWPFDTPMVTDSGSMVLSGAPMSFDVSNLTLPRTATLSFSGQSLTVSIPPYR